MLRIIEGQVRQKIGESAQGRLSVAWLNWLMCTKRDLENKSGLDFVRVLCLALLEREDLRFLDYAGVDDHGAPNRLTLAPALAAIQHGWQMDHKGR